MSTDKGYIKLYRSIQKNDIWKYQREKFDRVHAWIDMLMLAYYEESQVEGLKTHKTYNLERGQFLIGYRELAERWKWKSTSTVAAFVAYLLEHNMITKTRTDDGTLFSIINYCKYQDVANTNPNADRTLTERKKNADRTKRINIKKYKENKEINKPSAEKESKGTITHEEWLTMTLEEREAYREANDGWGFE